MPPLDAATRSRPAHALHFEVHRSALAEAGADAALAATWVMLWLVFLLALAPPTRAWSGSAAAGQAPPSARASVDVPAQPDAGPSARGVAPADPGGAG
jgi:hypothetical protein